MDFVNITHEVKDALPDELAEDAIVNNPADGDMLIYNRTRGQWETVATEWFEIVVDVRYDETSTQLQKKTRWILGVKATAEIGWQPFGGTPTADPCS